MADSPRSIPPVVAPGPVIGAGLGIALGLVGTSVVDARWLLVGSMGAIGVFGGMAFDRRLGRQERGAGIVGLVAILTFIVLTRGAR